MNRFASTRSEKRAVQPSPAPAQWRVGSIDEDGIRYGFTTHALMGGTIATAPTTVTIQSIAIRHGRGRRWVRWSTGFLTTASAPGSARAATRRSAHGHRKTARLTPAT